MAKKNFADVLAPSLEFIKTHPQEIARGIQIVNRKVRGEIIASPHAARVWNEQLKKKSENKAEALVMKRTENEFMLQVKWHGVNETPEISNKHAIYDDEREEYFYHCDGTLVLAVKDKETGTVRTWESYSTCTLTYGKFEGKDDSIGFYQASYYSLGETTTVEPINDDRYEVVAWAFMPVIGIKPYKEEA